MKAPPGFRMKWRQMRLLGTRVVITGHGPHRPDGSFAGKPGKVGAELTLEKGFQAARDTAMAVLGDLARELGDLDLVVNWVRVSAWRTRTWLSRRTPSDRRFYGSHAIAFRRGAGDLPSDRRSMAELAFDAPVIIEGEAENRL